MLTKSKLYKVAKKFKKGPIVIKKSGIAWGRVRNSKSRVPLFFYSDNLFKLKGYLP